MAERPVPDGERPPPAHPHLTAALLMLGVVAFLVIASVLSVL